MTFTTDPRPARPPVRLVRTASCAPRQPRLTVWRARRDLRRARRRPAVSLQAATAAAARASLSGPAAAPGARWAGLLVWALALAAHAVVAVAVWRTRAASPIARTSARITVQVRDLSPPPPAPRPTVPRGGADAAPAELTARGARSGAARRARARAGRHAASRAGQGGRSLARVDAPRRRRARPSPSATRWPEPPPGPRHHPSRPSPPSRPSDPTASRGASLGRAAC